MKKMVIDTLVRVNKSKAMKLFNSGVTIQIVPCNAQPKSIWFVNSKFNINDTIDKNFIKIVNDYTYYNCIIAYQKKYGLYPAYYVDINQLNNYKNI